MHQSPEECAGGEYDFPAGKFDAHARPHPRNTVCVCGRPGVILLRVRLCARGVRLCGVCVQVEQQFRRGVLPDVEVPGVFERAAPLLRKACFVALCPGTPHRGALRPVEHPELDGRTVGDPAHLTA